MPDAQHLELSMLYIGRSLVEPQELPKAALRGIGYSQWAYWSSLAIAIYSHHHLRPGLLRTLLVLTPILPALLTGAVAYWTYKSSDEYIRSRILQCIVITAVVFAASTLGYFLMELLGFPKRSTLWVNLLGWSVFHLQLLFVIFRSR